MYICHGIQSTKPARLHWNTILNLVLSYLGFVKHAIYHDLYTLNTNSTNDIIIVGCSIYDFLCAYSIIHLFKDFLAGINKYFPVTSKEVPQLSYLNICIIQSPCGISIYQTSHIDYTILAQWFPDASEKVNSDTTPFKADSTFVLDLVETLPDNPD